MPHKKGRSPKYKIRSLGGLAPSLVDRAVDVMAGVTVYDILTRRPQFKTDLIPNQDRNIIEKDVCCFGLLSALALGINKPRNFRAGFMSSRLVAAGYSPEMSTGLARIVIENRTDSGIVDDLDFFDDPEPDYGLLIVERGRVQVHELDEAAFVMGILSLDRTEHPQAD
ncbi:MAG: hypothetical protein ABI354_03070 [Candidatus Saccharimonadales bacterium]